MNHYKHEDHKEVSDAIKKIKNAYWITSYDNTSEIRELYSDKNIQVKEYSFFHTAHTIKEGKEILFFSQNLNLPTVIKPVNTSLKEVLSQY
jgi:DNA adenine methylase